MIRQAASYGVVGALQLLLDWFSFVALSSIGMFTVPANLVGRVSGAVLGFWLNGLLTFRDQSGSRLGWLRLRRFMISWGVMTALSTAGVYWIDHLAGLQWAWVAKPVLDSALAALGFLVSRFWIYK